MLGLRVRLGTMATDITRASLWRACVLMWDICGYVDVCLRMHGHRFLSRRCEVRTLFRGTISGDPVRAA